MQQVVSLEDTDARSDRQEREHRIPLMSQYLEIDRPGRLVFTFAVPTYSPIVTWVTIDIVPSDGGCELTLTHEGVPPEYAERNVEGWSRILAGLAGVE